VIAEKIAVLVPNIDENDASAWSVRSPAATPKKNPAERASFSSDTGVIEH